MQLTTFQPAEIYDENGALIRAGSWGPEKPFWDGHGRGVYDYIANNFEALWNGVGGAASSASTATTMAALAEAKLAEALQAKADAMAAKQAAEDAKTAALAAKADAELAASQAAEIVTPDGLAARVLALEGLPHYAYDNEGHLNFYYGRTVE